MVEYFGTDDAILGVFESIFIPMVALEFWRLPRLEGA